MNTEPVKNTRVWLIRHGEPETSSRGRCYGRLDIGLSPQGRLQVAKVAQSLRNEPIEAFYVSPRKRAIESCEILASACGRAVTIDERLREIDFGDFEGKPYDEIKRTYPETYQQWMQHPTEVQFPNGESFQQMKARVLKSAREIYDRHCGRTIAMVTHGGVNRILLSDALGIPDRNIFHIAQNYAALNLISFARDYSIVELLNGKHW